MNPQISSPLWIFQGSQLDCGGGSPPSALPSPSQPWHSPVAEGFQFMVAFMALGNDSAIIQAEIKPQWRPGGDSDSSGTAVPHILCLTSLCSGWWLWDSAPGCSGARTLLLLCQVSIGLWGCGGVSVLLNHAVVAVVGPHVLGFVPYSTSPCWAGQRERGYWWRSQLGLRVPLLTVPMWVTADFSAQEKGWESRPAPQQRLLHLILCTTAAPGATSHSECQDAPSSRGGRGQRVLQTQHG